MRKSCLFPYGITLQDSGEITMFPAADVLFYITTNKWAPAFLLIDSGATISALPRSDASVLGVVAEQGTQMTVKGIGGVPVHGWKHEIRIKLGENILTVPLVFLADPETPRVLGRAGIFEKFFVIFEESKHRTGLVSKQDTKAKIIHKVLDGLQGKVRK